MTRARMRYQDMAKKSPVSEKTTSEMDMHVTSVPRKRKITSGKAAVPLGRSGEYVKKCARDGMPVLEAGDPKMPGGREYRRPSKRGRGAAGRPQKIADSAPASA